MEAKKLVAQISLNSDTIYSTHVKNYDFAQQIVCA